MEDCAAAAFEVAGGTPVGSSAKGSETWTNVTVAVLVLPLCL